MFSFTVLLGDIEVMVRFSDGFYAIFCVINYVLFLDGYIDNYCLRRENFNIFGCIIILHILFKLNHTCIIVSSSKTASIAQLVERPF